MANWTRTQVVALGTDTAVTALMNNLESGPDELFSFHHLAPSSSDPNDHLVSWGTQWEANCEDRDSVTFPGGRRTTWQFTTSWTAPTRALAKLTEKYPKIRFYIAIVDEDPALGSTFTFSADDGSWVEHLFTTGLALRTCQPAELAWTLTDVHDVHENISWRGLTTVVVPETGTFDPAQLGTSTRDVSIRDGVVQVRDTPLSRLLTLCGLAAQEYGWYEIGDVIESDPDLPQVWPQVLEHIQAHAGDRPDLVGALAAIITSDPDLAVPDPQDFIEVGQSLLALPGPQLTSTLEVLTHMRGTSHDLSARIRAALAATT